MAEPTKAEQLKAAIEEMKTALQQEMGGVPESVKAFEAKVEAILTPAAAG